MQSIKWWMLQIFADGGEGGSAGGDGVAAATGESDAAAGHQRLRDLGVPESKIRKNRSYKAGAMKQQAAVAEQTNATEDEPAHVDDVQKPTEGKRMTWDEIKADPEYNEQLQKMMRERTKKAKAAEETLEKLTPALEKLALGYGLDAADFTHDDLVNSIMADKSRYRDRAIEMGVDEEIVEKLERFDLMEAKQKREKEVSVKDKAMQEHYAGLVQQGDALKGKYPGFDLNAELKNPTFARLTAPGMPISVEDAYYLIHRKEIEQAALKATAQQTAQNVANAVRSGTMRPKENGASSAAPSVSTFSYKNASQEQRNALKQRIKLAAAKGEKLYPGQ